MQTVILYRKFRISLIDHMSDSADLKCGVPQGSILGPLIFLLYINDMPGCLSRDSELLLYADDSCLIVQDKDEKKIEQVLNEDFSKLCDWFLDNKLSIHFGEDKTKCILFAKKTRVKNARKINISYNNIEIKEKDEIEYLGCILDRSMSGESVALSVLKKINYKLKFLYRQNRFFSRSIRRLLCNSIIQPNFDYA